MSPLHCSAIYFGDLVASSFKVAQLSPARQPSVTGAMGVGAAEKLSSVLKANGSGMAAGERISASIRARRF